MRRRHAQRLANLIEIIPEPEVRKAIVHAIAPQAVFYQAWTLHEALYKLESLKGTTPKMVLDTRLRNLTDDGDIKAWQWQSNRWTLSVCAYAENLQIRIQPDIPLSRVKPPWKQVRLTRGLGTDAASRAMTSSGSKGAGQDAGVT